MFSSLLPSFFPRKFSPGKLINYLIAAKKRHRIAGREIENGAAQFFLGSRCAWTLSQSRSPCSERDPSERNANARNAHAIRSQRNQLVIGREPAEHEQDGSQ